MSDAAIRLARRARRSGSQFSSSSLRSALAFIAGKPLTVTILTLGSALVYAAHPLNTDDTGTQGSGLHQIEINSDRLRQGKAQTGVATATYSLGLRSDVDLFLNTPVTLTSPSGINDVTIGSKWRFYDQNQNSAALRADLRLPSGELDNGLGTGRASAALTLIGSQMMAPWAFHANAGIAMNRYALATDRDTKRKFVWRASVAAAYAVTTQWRLVADTGISQSTERYNAALPAYFLSGAIYSPSADIDLDAGIRLGVGCKGCADQIDRQLGVGMTWRF